MLEGRKKQQKKEMVNKKSTQLVLSTPVSWNIPNAVVVVACFGLQNVSVKRRRTLTARS